jgi:predicted Zn-dependent protease
VLDDLEGLVRASEQAAREAGPADDYAPLVTGDADASFTTPADVAATDIFSAAARGLGEGFAAARTDGRRLFGYAWHDVTTTWLGSSTGLRRRHAQPTGYIELTGKNDLPGGSSWVGQHTRDWSDVSVPSLDAELQRRLGWSKRHIDLPAGRYETLLPSSAVADLLTYMYWTSSGREAAEGRTVFSRAGGGTRIGEALAPTGLTLRGDPHDPALATIPFVVTSQSSAFSSVFDNGLDVGATDWIADGTLRALVETRASAARNGTAVTPYVDNLILDAGGTASIEDMVATTERGLLLTCMWYIREVDPEKLLLTGLTRDGVYLIEGGEVTGVVNNFRWNESPVDLLGRLAEVGRSGTSLPREWSDDFTWVQMPAVRVADFNMSSVSQAS